MPEPKFCCDMRARYLVGIIGVDPSIPIPVDMADCVVEWEPKIIIRIRYCPFCGKEIPLDDTVRKP